MNRILSLGQYVKLNDDSIHMILESITEDENYILFVLEDLNIVKWSDIKEVIEEN